MMMESVEVRFEFARSISRAFVSSLLASGDRASPEKQLEDALCRLAELRQGAGLEGQEEYELAVRQACALYELKIKQPVFEKLRLEEGDFEETVALLELPPTAKVTRIRINAMNPNGIFFPVFEFSPDGLLDSYQPFFSIVFSGQMSQSPSPIS